MLKPLAKEARVREILSRELGVAFTKKRLLLKTKKGWHEFDLVSQDGKIIGEVKSDKHTDKGFATTRFPRAMLACRYLELVNAERKLMIFTDSQFYEKFRQKSSGLLIDNIEIRLVEVS